MDVCLSVRYRTKLGCHTVIDSLSSLLPSHFALWVRIDHSDGMGPHQRDLLAVASSQFQFNSQRIGTNSASHSDLNLLTVPVTKLFLPEVRPFFNNAPLFVQDGIG